MTNQERIQTIIEDIRRKHFSLVPYEVMLRIIRIILDTEPQKIKTMIELWQEMEKK